MDNLLPEEVDSSLGNANLKEDLLQLTENTATGDRVLWQPGPQRAEQISYDPAPQDTTKAGFYAAKASIANSQARPSTNAANYTFLGALLTQAQRAALAANTTLSATNAVADMDALNRVNQALLLGYARGEESISVGPTTPVFNPGRRPRAHFLLESPDLTGGGIVSLDLSLVPLGGFFQIRNPLTNQYLHSVKIVGGDLIEGYLPSYQLAPGDRVVLTKQADGVYTSVGTFKYEGAAVTAPAASTLPFGPYTATGDPTQQFGPLPLVAQSLRAVNVRRANPQPGQYPIFPIMSDMLTLDPNDGLSFTSAISDLLQNGDKIEGLCSGQASTGGGTTPPVTTGKGYQATYTENGPASA